MIKIDKIIKDYLTILVFIITQSNSLNYFCLKETHHTCPMSVLKITSFKRNQSVKDKQQIRPFSINKDPIAINVLLFSESDSYLIDSFEKWIISQHNQIVNFIKIVDRKSIIPTFKSVLEKKHRKTFVISTKSLTRQLQSLIMANNTQYFSDLILQLKFILLVDKVQEIDPKSFWTKQIYLISSKVQDVQACIGLEIQKLWHAEPQEVSSLNSENQAAFEQQFIKKYNPILLPKQGQKKQETKGEIVFNDIPGVGSYEISVDQKFKGSLSGTFSKQKKQRE